MLSSPPAPSSPNTRKILVIVYNWFYAVDAYEPPSLCDGMRQYKDRRVHAIHIEERLRAIVRDAEARLANGEKAVPVGVLSADQRDIWAKVLSLLFSVSLLKYNAYGQNLRHLLDLSSVNRKTVDVIHQSLMGLSMDHVTTAIPHPEGIPCTPESKKQLELDSHLQSIRTANPSLPLSAKSSPKLGPAHNRFYDKCFTLIIDPSTRAGAMGEHSPCDALVPSIVAEYALVADVDPTAFISDREKDVSEGQGWERLPWITDSYIEQECLHAEERATIIIENSDDSGFWFEEYGAEWIKNIGAHSSSTSTSTESLTHAAPAKQSPDAYIQMALQLAYYRARKQFAATYETALTRMFDGGRTETIRTLTRDSRAWVLAMVDSSVSVRLFISSGPSSKRTDMI
jgi:hypothetical protein